MKKRRLLTAAILASVILCKPAWAAECTFGTVFDSNTNQHNVVVSPDKSQWNYAYKVANGIYMYYPILGSQSDNLLTVNMFIKPIKKGNFILMLFYILGQVLIYIPLILQIQK